MLRMTVKMFYDVFYDNIIDICKSFGKSFKLITRITPAR